MSANGWKKTPQDNFFVLALSEAFEIRNSINIQDFHSPAEKVRQDK